MVRESVRESDTNGVAGVGFLQSWILLFLARAMLGHGSFASIILIGGSAVWICGAAWFLCRKIRRATNPASLDDDIDFILCAALLGVTLPGVGFLLVQVLRVDSRRAGMIFLALLSFGSVLRNLRRGNERIR